MSLQYNPSNCIACGVCQKRCLLGEGAIPSVNPLVINNNCLDCGACEAECPEGKAVLRSDLDYLLPNFVSVFGDLKPKNEQPTSTTPENPKDNTGSEGKDQGQPSENPKENPSQNPSDKDKDKGESSKTESSQDKSESSPSDKDTKNDTDKSDEKSESSTSDSSTKSEFIPTPPPPTQITSSINILQEINSLQRYLATIK